MPETPDLRTAAQALSDALDEVARGEYGIDDIKAERKALVAALAAEATELPASLRAIRTRGYNEKPGSWFDGGHLDVPPDTWVYVVTDPGPAPDPQGADEPNEGSFVPVLPGYYEEVARRLAATGGVPDEPGDDDPQAWAERVREATTEVLDPNDLALALTEVKQRGSAQYLRLVHDSHENLRAEVERLRAAAPASGDDGQRRTRLVRERLVSAIDAHVAKTHEPLSEDTDPATAAALFSEDSVELLLKAAELLRAAGRTPPTPGPTREQVHGALYQAYVDHTAKPSSLTVGDMGHLTDAVMALWSTPSTVLWEGKTKGYAGVTTESWIAPPLWDGVPPGTHVAVTRSEP